MDSYIPWVVGKRAIRDVILACFPQDFTRYIEVFGGAAWVLFHKRPGPFEVYNDFNPLLANLFRCVRDKPEELKAALLYCLNSREGFKINSTVNGMTERLEEILESGSSEELDESSEAIAGVKEGMAVAFAQIEELLAEQSSSDAEEATSDAGEETTGYEDDPVYQAALYFKENADAAYMGFTETNEDVVLIETGDTSALLFVDGNTMQSMSFVGPYETDGALFRITDEQSGPTVYYPLSGKEKDPRFARIIGESIKASPRQTATTSIGAIQHGSVMMKS